MRRGLCPRQHPRIPKIRSRGRGLVCFARRRPGTGVRPCAPPGPRLRAQRLEGLAGAAGVFHREEKVTRGRGRESRGRGLTTPEPGSGLDASGHRVLGLSCSRLPWPRGPVWWWPLKSVWVLWPGASQGIWKRSPRAQAGHGKPSPLLSLLAHHPRGPWVLSRGQRFFLPTPWGGRCF